MIYWRNIGAISTVGFLLVIVSWAIPQYPDHAPGEILVKVRSAEDIAPIAESLGAISYDPLLPNGNSSLKNWFLLKFPQDADPITLAQKAYENPRIIHAQTNNLYRLCDQVIPNDPDFEKQWNMKRIRMPEAWEIERGSRDVVIAVIDTGVNYEHDDLKDQIWHNEDEIPDNGIDDDGNGFIDDEIGWDFTDAPTMPGRGDYTGWDNDPMDDSGHGSHVAGIVGAKPNNGIGVAGVGWGCRIMCLRAGFRVLTGGTFLQDDDVSAAIVYATDNGARVINMSWGDPDPSFVIRDAVDYAYQRGVVLVGAAGNDSQKSVMYPAAYKQVIAVAASDQADHRAYFSNASAAVDVAAPGMQILSLGTTTEPYWTSSGTSMATPHVAGVAALCLSLRPDLTPEDVRTFIVASADPMEDSPKLVDAGRLNALKTLLEITPLKARITSPENNTSFSDPIVVFGSAGGQNFGGYQLLVGEGTVPERWSPITSVMRNSVHSGELGVWDVTYVAAGTYTIRLEVTSTDNSKVERDEVIVHISRALPEFKTIRFDQSIHGNRFETDLIWETDVPSTARINVFSVTDETTPLRLIEIDQPRHSHRIAVSQILTDGTYKFLIEAISPVGFSEETTIEANIMGESISPNGYREISSGLPVIHPVDTENSDLNGNGVPELWGMLGDDQGYGNIVAYEFDSQGLPVRVSTLPIKAYPWWIDDIDGNGKPEYLVNEGALTYLYEDGRRIWSIDDTWGGTVADSDGDEKPELILKTSRYNETQIYEFASGWEFVKTGSLGNPSAGYNSIRYIALGNMDGDSLTDIVLVDEDCDLIYYENIGNNRYSMRYFQRVMNGTPVLFTSGDINDDGMDELLLGVLEENGGNSIVNILKLMLLNISPSGPRVVGGREIIRGTSLSNAAKMVDIDGDSRKEIVLTTYDSVYVLDGSLIPLFHRNISGDNKRIATIGVDGGVRFGLNTETGFSLFQSESDIRALGVPWNLRAISAEEGQVELSWDFRGEYDEFRIYRAEGNDQIEFTAISRSLRYLDTGLNVGMTYRYAVSSVVNGVESDLSPEIQIEIPPALSIIEVKPIPPSRVRILFSHEVDESAQNTNAYMLNGMVMMGALKQITKPSSALIVSPRECLVTFEGSPLKPGGKYAIIVSGIRATNGSAIDEEIAEFSIPPSESLPKNLDLVRAYPNPVSLSSNAPRVVFDHLPLGARISIYSMDGNIVSRLPRSDLDGVVIWDLLNDSSNSVSSGVYIFVIEYKELSRRGKVAVIR